MFKLTKNNFISLYMKDYFFNVFVFAFNFPKIIKYINRKTELLNIIDEHFATGLEQFKASAFLINLFFFGGGRGSSPPKKIQIFFFRAKISIFKANIFFFCQNNSPHIRNNPV